MNRTTVIRLLLCVAIPIPLIIIGALPCSGPIWYCRAGSTVLVFVFPYSIISAFVFGKTVIPIVAIAILQFPIYGLSWYALRRKTRFRFPGWSLVAMHVMLGIVALVVWIQFIRPY